MLHKGKFYQRKIDITATTYFSVNCKLMQSPLTSKLCQGKRNQIANQTSQNQLYAFEIIVKR